MFNEISLFENNNLLSQFIEYSKQDSISLLNALIKAQDIYLTEYNVDICSIWSTSTLSFKIFRLKFLEMNIPILTKTLDNVIRLAYLGWSTDYFYKYGENLKHYDVNSLYSKAMCNPMAISVEKKTLIETKNVFKSEISKYYGSYTIFSEIDINKEISTILMSTNLDYDLINEIKQDTGFELLTNFRKVKSNVAIAAAVTSYARIEMIELKMLLIKLNIKLYYTDTDSIFVDKELPSYLIGKELGQLKDELNGGIIKKAYFLGIKKYGYIDSNNVTHSVFSGVERNSLTWNEIESIANGNIIHKTVSNRFYKDFKSLSIAINISKLSIKFDTFKILKHNIYQPIKLNFSLRNKFSFYERLILARIKIFIRKFKHLIED